MYDNLKIVLVRFRDNSLVAYLWSDYTEAQRYGACQFAKEQGWTVHYPETDDNREAIKLAIEKHLEIS